MSLSDYSRRYIMSLYSSLRLLGEMHPIRSTALVKIDKVLPGKNHKYSWPDLLKRHSIPTMRYSIRLSNLVPKTPMYTMPRHVPLTLYCHTSGKSGHFSHKHAVYRILFSGLIVPFGTCEIAQGSP